MSDIVLIKIGTATVTKDGGRIDLELMYNVAYQVKQLKKRGKKVVLVSSGAIGCGLQVTELGRTPNPEEVSLKQVCAAVGQVQLMRFWQQAFGELIISQHLITHNIFTHEGNLADFNNCLKLALDHNLIPIINENDPVSTKEIDEKFTDNDELGVKVALAIGAKRMIILSDVAGLYTDNPQTNSEAKMIPKVEEINNEMFKFAKGKSKLGRGGMIGKLEAVGRAMEGGIDVYLTYGKQDKAILNTFDDNFVGTVFKAK